MGCRGSKNGPNTHDGTVAGTLLNEDTIATKALKPVGDVLTNPPALQIVQAMPRIEDLLVMSGGRRSAFRNRKNDLDVYITEFSVEADNRIMDVDHSQTDTANAKSIRWKILFDREAAPLDLHIGVRDFGNSREVSVAADGAPLLRGQEALSMTEDFHYDWLLHSTVPGIGEVNFFDVQHQGGEEWLPATITWQQNGVFEVIAQTEDESGEVQRLQLDGVKKSNLRRADTQKPIVIMESCLMLCVPKRNPLAAVLSVNDDEMVTHRFGRPSPPHTQAKASISLQLSRDRNFITASVSERVLGHFASGETFAETSTVDKTESSWVFHLGPLARHTLTISRHSSMNGLLDLHADGELFIHACASDLGCEDGTWRCSFRFIGERVLDFEVFKTDTNGFPLEETGHVEEKRKYVHECSVVVSDESDLSTAQFAIDGVDFKRLPTLARSGREPTAAMSSLAMLQTYGIEAPNKVDRNAVSSVAVLPVIAKRAPKHHAETMGLGNIFFGGCCAPQTEPDLQTNFHEVGN